MIIKCKSYFYCCFYLLLALATTSCWSTNSLQEEPTSEISFLSIREMIETALVERNIPSVSVSVAHKGLIIWEESFGWADRENEIKASPDTVYSIASLTKPMTATAIMTLENSGAVLLDSPIENFISPELLTFHEGSSQDVTIKQVLQHTSGLPQYFNYFYDDETDEVKAIEEVLQNFGTIVWSPGNEFVYSNLGYGLLGSVIETVSSKSLSTYMKDDVFVPLDMKKTVFDPDSELGIAVKYDHDGNIIPFMRTDTPGSGSAYASVHDLIKFGMFHLNGEVDNQIQIIDNPTIKEMQQAPIGISYPDSVSTRYGLGWFLGETPEGVQVVMHEGGWTGASAMLKLIPSEDLAVAVTMNVFDSEFINLLTDEILATALPDSDLIPGSIYPDSTESFVLQNGRYSGEITMSEQTVPISIEKSDDMGLYAFIGDSPSPDPVSLRIIPDFVPRLPGHFLASLPVSLNDENAQRRPHDIFLELKLTDNGMEGTATARGQATPLRGNERQYFLLPYHITLDRNSN
ncbi:MAG: hypothetical protein CMP91_11715 [Gammaproteobacteria bacterium]|nr:hypothetical protein [Gammaproteobacteria bacterium]MAY02224.1 hypothetical protein [Gammaproteobacteria bacterium]